MPNGRTFLFYFLPLLLAIAVVLAVNFKTDLSAFIITGNNTEEILLASEMQSGELSRRYLISIGAAEVGKVSKTLLLELRDQFSTIDGVAEVWLPEQQTDFVDVMESLYSLHGSALYSLEPERDLPELFSLAGLTQRAEFLKKALLSPQAAMIKKIALQDPLLLTLDGFQSLGNQLRQSPKNDATYRNLILETKMAGLDAVEQRRIQTSIHDIFNKLNSFRHHQFLLEMTGVPVFVVATQTLIQGDIILVSVLSSVALIVLFLLLFRSFRALFQVFTLLIIALLTAILTTHFIFGYVHGMTVAIGSTLVGICIDYPIHAIAHARTISNEARSAAVHKIWPSMLLGGMTTLVGYIALGLSGYPGFQQVAVYAGSGIVTALLLTRFVLPELVKGDGQQLKIPMVTGWMGICRRFRPLLLVALVTALTASLVGLKSLRWMEDLQQLTPELDSLKENDKRIRARMISVEPGRFILITGSDIEAALQKADQVYPILENLKQVGDLSDYFGLYPWILSVQKQQQNRSRLQYYLTEENLTLWREALKIQGLSVNRLGHFDYPDLPPLTLAQVFETPVKKIIDSRVISTEQQAIIMIWLAGHQPEALTTAFADIEGARYFSQRDLLNSITKDYTEKAQLLLMIGLVLILLLLLVRFKSILKTLQTLLPAVLAAFLILGIWSLSGVQISFLHLVGFLLAVSICVDYGIFYQENRGGNINLTYQAMAASMLTSSLAFGSLIAAESTSLRILAGVVAFGVILGFLFCPIIIKHDQP